MFLQTSLAVLRVSLMRTGRQQIKGHCEDQINHQHSSTVKMKIFNALPAIFFVATRHSCRCDFLSRNRVLSPGSRCGGPLVASSGEWAKALSS